METWTRSFSSFLRSVVSYKFNSIQFNSIQFNSIQFNSIQSKERMEEGRGTAVPPPPPALSPLSHSSSLFSPLVVPLPSATFPSTTNLPTQMNNLSATSAQRAISPVLLAPPSSLTWHKREGGGEGSERGGGEIRWRRTAGWPSAAWPAPRGARPGPARGAGRPPCRRSWRISTSSSAEPSPGEADGCTGLGCRV